MREMKDSGIPWIGEIPKEWETKNIGQFYTHRVEKVSDKDYAPLSVTKNGIVPQLETAAKTDDGDNRKLVRVGDFCINSRSDRRGSCGISPYDGSVSLINTILTPRSEMSPRYYDWLFHTTMFADEFYKWGHGIVDDLWTTRWQEMKRIAIPTPSLAEQQRIAEFLDRKCAEVDEMIGLQEQIIEELKAYKQSVITEAVTKGLNPAAPMRDSGIEWIGSIPEHWEIKRLKQESTFINGFAFDSEDFKIDEGIKVIRIGDIGLQVDFENCVRATTDASLLSSYKIANGDILIAMSGATTGKCCIVEKAEDAYINQRVGIIRSNSYKFLYYMLQVPYFQEYISLNNAGSAQPNISSSAISDFSLPLPPLSEQEAIANFLDKKTCDIDTAIERINTQIADLQAYRTALISEAVTGKIDVRL